MIPKVTAWFTRHIGLKVLALLLALAVYAHVYTEQEQEWRLRLPLALVGLPHQLVLLDSPPDEVVVKARGKGKLLLKLKMQRPRMAVDLRGIHPGAVQRILSPADVQLPPGSEVAVTEVEQPRMLTLSVDTLITRRVPVRVNVTGDLPESYVLEGPIRADPNRVRVRGPSRVVKGLTALGTEPLRLDRLEGEKGLVLRLAADTLRITVEPGSVRVDVPLLRLVPRTLPPEAVRFQHLGRGLRARVEPDSAGVVVRGPSEVVAGLSPDRVEVVLDLADLGPGRHLLSPQVRLPDPRLHLVTVHPARFLVEIRGRTGSRE